MNALLPLLLLSGGLSNIFGGASGGSSSGLLPLMLLGGGRMNTMGMLGIITNNPMLTIMGMTQKSAYRRYRRNYKASAAYWRGRAQGARYGYSG